LKPGSDSEKILKEICLNHKIHSNDLKEILQFGFAVHHAGLHREDRDLVESLFSGNHI